MQGQIQVLTRGPGGKQKGTVGSGCMHTGPICRFFCLVEGVGA